MQKLLLTAIGIVTVVLTCGCDNAKSSAAVAKDVAIAQQQASTVMTEAKKDAAKEGDSAKASYEVAIAQADGDHNVAIQKCSALNGMALKSCKDQADASYESAKTHANVIRLNN